MLGVMSYQGENVKASPFDPKKKLTGTPLSDKVNLQFVKVPSSKREPLKMGDAIHLNKRSRSLFNEDIENIAPNILKTKENLQKKDVFQAPNRNSQQRLSFDSKSSAQTLPTQKQISLSSSPEPDKLILNRDIQNTSPTQILDTPLTQILDTSPTQILAPANGTWSQPTIPMTYQETSSDWSQTTIPVTSQELNSVFEHYIDDNKASSSLVRKSSFNFQSSPSQPPIKKRRFDDPSGNEPSDEDWISDYIDAVIHNREAEFIKELKEKDNPSSINKLNLSIDQEPTSKVEIESELKKTSANPSKEKVNYYFDAPYEPNEFDRIEHERRLRLTEDDYRNELIDLMVRRFGLNEKHLVEEADDRLGNWDCSPLTKCLTFCQNLAFHLYEFDADDSFDEMFAYFESEEEWPQFFGK